MHASHVMPRLLDTGAIPVVLESADPPSPATLQWIDPAPVGEVSAFSVTELAGLEEGGKTAL